MRFDTEVPSVRGRLLIAAFLLLSLIMVGVGIARAGEIVPSVGISRPVDGDADSQIYGGVAVRENLLPLVRGEIGVAYRSESRFDDQLRIRSWPITASAYLTPGPLYAGGGVGWYQTTFDYKSTVPLADETKQEFGVHLGGGIELPLGPNAGVDLNGRYVMMREQESRLVPEKFDPDFWTTSVGLAFKF